MPTKCIHPDCIKYPIFNYSTEPNATCCADHMKEGMIDVIHKRCIETNCMTRPSYNYSTETKAIYCNEHKKT